MTAANHELSITCLIDAPREAVFRCWTEEALITRWFTPAPWETPSATLDVRPGGSNLIVMRDPEGNEFPNRGVYLEVEPNRRLVITDAYTEAWVPSEKPFMTTLIELEDEDGKTRYTATARHWNEEDCRAHEEMGFREGWMQCARQLEAVAKTL